tara:strand:+ start:221 stop:457 length:237 start_codon:yes stop_codon:yes gene_type:complete
MEDLIANFASNDWFKYVTLAITIAAAVAAVTPTPKDGSIWAKVYKGIDWLALNVGKAKQVGTPATKPAEEAKAEVVAK